MSSVLLRFNAKRWFVAFFEDCGIFGLRCALPLDGGTDSCLYFLMERYVVT